MPNINADYASHVQQRLAVASDAYEDGPTGQPLPGGWQRSFDSNATSEWKGGMYAVLYERRMRDNPEYMIAFRGFDDLADLDDIARVKLGGLPGQVDHAIEFSRQMAMAHNVPMSSIHYVGHSLGGYLARAVGLVAEAPESYAFNSPGLYPRDLAPLSELRRKFNALAPDITATEVAYRGQDFNASDDIVPRFGKIHGSTTTISSDPLNPHSIDRLSQAFDELAAAPTGLLGNKPAPEQQPHTSRTSIRPVAGASVS